MSGETEAAARYRALARLCRRDAARSTTAETSQLLLAKAEDYERQADALERPAH
jgi:hypothetical protein